MVCPITNGKDKGFTIVELMVVLALVSLLLTLALPRYFDGLERAKESVLKQDLAVMRKAIDHYHSDTGQYPFSLQTLVTQKYLKTIPVDPITQQADTWVSESVPGAIGIYNVFSGASGKATNGSPYADW